MYNRVNLLRKMVEIQDITLEHQRRGVSNDWTYQNVIQPKYLISRSTYYQYLATNARKELKELLKNETI